MANNIDTIFTTYDEEISHYISRGTMDFENAVIAETDPTMLAIFAIPTVAPSTKFPSGLTVKGSILYQLNGKIP